MEINVKMMTDQLRVTNSDEDVAAYLRSIITSDLAKNYWEKKLYSEKEVAELLDVQRGNCYVAALSKTRNTEIAEAASSAPEPSGGKWRK